MTTKIIASIASFILVLVFLSPVTTYAQDSTTSNCDPNIETCDSTTTTCDPAVDKCDADPIPCDPAVEKCEHEDPPPCDPAVEKCDFEDPPPCDSTSTECDEPISCDPNVEKCDDLDPLHCADGDTCDPVCDPDKEVCEPACDPEKELCEPLCDPNNEVCEPVCDTDKELCEPLCDTGTEICEPLCDTQKDVCEPPPCDPEKEVCDHECDPETGECKSTCDSTTGACDIPCDPETEICEPVCDPEREICEPLCDITTEECKALCDPHVELCEFLDVDPTALIDFDLGSITDLDPRSIIDFTDEHIENLDPSVVFGFTREQLEEFAPDVLKAFDQFQLGNLDADAVKGFSFDQLAGFDIDAVSGFTEDHLANFDHDALSGFSTDQFQQLDHDALDGFTRDNLGGFSTDVLHDIDPTDLTAFNQEEFKNLTDEEFSRFIANLDPSKISPEDLEGLLRDGWTIDPVTGELFAPAGADIFLTSLNRVDGDENLDLPDLPDFTKGFGLGGGSGSGDLLADLDAALHSGGIEGFRFRQTAEGILLIVDENDPSIVIAAFIPDTNNTTQAPDGFVPGIFLDERGAFVMITEDGLQIPLLPAAKDFGGLTEFVGGVDGTCVQLGEGGETFIGNPDGDGGAPIIGIFDPLISDTDAAPGLYREGDGADEIITLVFEDGRAQIMHPTIQSPGQFKGILETVTDISEVQFNTDGSISLNFGGNDFILKPLFDIELATELVDPCSTEGRSEVDPILDVNENGDLIFTNSYGDTQIFVIAR